MELAAGVEPASFQLRLTPLEAETDTRAISFLNFGLRISRWLNVDSLPYALCPLPVDLAQAVGLEPTTFRLTGGHRQPTSVA